MYKSMPSVYIRAEDLNSGLHVCIAGTSQVDLALQFPCTFILPSSEGATFPAGQLGPMSLSHCTHVLELLLGM